MKELLIEWKGLNKQGRRVWIWRGGSSSAVTIPLGDVPGGNKMSQTDR